MNGLRSPVYVIVNYVPGGRESAAAISRAAVDGGAGMIQLRAKHALRLADIDFIRDLVSMARDAQVRFVVNDFVDVVRAVAADGVHVGLEDTPVVVAREELGPDAIVGATTPTVELARRAQEHGASYVAVGAVFPSPTKPDKRTVGLERVRDVAGAVGVPVCAIGGITADGIPQVMAAGATLAAVIAAVSAAPDPLEAVRELVAACHER